MPTMTPLTDADRQELGAMVEQMLDAWWARKMRISASEHDMVSEHGEAVSHRQAAEILGVTAPTITAMLRDGRLTGSSKHVSVRSIAKHLDAGRPSAQKVKRMAEYERKRAAGVPVFDRG